MIWIPPTPDCLDYASETEKHCSGFLLTHGRHLLQLWKTVDDIEEPVVDVFTSCPMECTINTMEFLEKQQILAVAKSDVGEKVRDSRIAFYHLSASHMCNCNSTVLKIPHPTNHVCYLSFFQQGFLIHCFV